MVLMRAVSLTVVALIALTHVGYGDDRVPLGFTAVDLNAERANLPGKFPASVKTGFVIRSVEFDFAMERWGLRPATW